MQVLDEVLRGRKGVGPKKVPVEAQERHWPPKKPAYTITCTAKRSTCAASPRRNRSAMTIHMTRSRLLCAFTIAIGPFCSKAQVVSDAFLVPNWEVHAIGDYDGHVLVAGAFTALAPNTGWGAYVDADSGSVLPGYLDRRVNGRISTTYADPSGGMYIAGDFTLVAGQSRRGFAHFDAQGGLTPWAPSHNGFIRDFLLAGDTLWVSGSFDTLNGVFIRSLGALDANTGSLLAWDADVEPSEVLEMATDGPHLYVIGSFTSIGGQPRDGLAALDRSTALATPFTASADDAYRTILLDDDLLYIGGAFTTINGVPRSKLAAFDLQTGNLAPFVADCSSSFVQDLEISGDTLFVAGSYTSINGQPRTSLASVDRSTGNVHAWAPAVIGSVTGLAVDGSRVFLAGGFLTVGQESRWNYVCVDRSAGMPLPWDPKCALSTGGKLTLLDSGRIYLCGTASLAPLSPNQIDKKRLASFSISTGALDPLDVDIDSTVRAMAVRGDTLVIGGDFTFVNGLPRAYFAALSLSTGQVLPWSIVPDDPIVSLAFGGDTLFVAGRFDVVDGSPRRRLAAFDRISGALLPWNPNAGGTGFQQFRGIHVADDQVYAFGQFDNIGGIGRFNCAQFLLPSGALSPWEPIFDDEVRAVVTEGARVYATGDFEHVTGQEIEGACALDMNTGLVQPWLPTVFNTIYGGPADCAVVGNEVFIAGPIAAGDGADHRIGVCGLGSVSANVTPTWSANTDPYTYVHVVHPADGFLFIGGRMLTVSNEMHPFFAAIGLPCLSVDIASSVDATCPTGADGTASLVIAGGTPPYSVDWNTQPVQSGPAAADLPPGIFTASISDAGSCATAFPVLIDGPSPALGFDATATLTATAFRPGKTSTIFAVASNHGCDPVAGQITVVLDSLLSFSSAVPAPASINGDTLSWSFPPIVFGGSSFIAQISVMTDTTATLGDTVCLTASVLPVLGDADPSNNAASFCEQVFNAYDPNDKQVLPRGEGVEGRIPQDQQLIYTIRFQNTGTATADHVVIRDTLDADLDPGSFIVLAHSHPMTASAQPGGAVKFSFLGIQLPDSTCCEPASHGFVTYAIKPFPGLPNGTEVRNTAAIYFDYNPPVITNTVLNTIDISLGAPTLDRRAECPVHPNPSTGILYGACFRTPGTTFTIRDLAGREYSSGILDGTGIFDLSHLSNGIYVLQAGPSTTVVTIIH